MSGELRSNNEFRSHLVLRPGFVYCMLRVPQIMQYVITCEVTEDHDISNSFDYQSTAGRDH